MASSFTSCSTSFSRRRAASVRCRERARAAARYCGRAAALNSARSLRSTSSLFSISFSLRADFFAVSDDGLERLSVLALQAIERGQPVFDLGQPLRRGVDAAGIVAQRSRPDLRQRCAPNPAMPAIPGTAHRSARVPPPAATLPARSWRPRLRPRTAGRRRSWQRRRSSRHWRGRAFPPPAARLRRPGAARPRSPSSGSSTGQPGAACPARRVRSSAMRLANCRAMRQRRRRPPAWIASAEQVEQLEARGGVEAQDGLALRVHRRQHGRELLEHGHRRRLVVDEDAPAARRRRSRGAE